MSTNSHNSEERDPLQPIVNESESDSPTESNDDPSPGQLLDNVLHETLAATNSENIVPLITRFVEQDETAEITDLDVATRLIDAIIDSRMGSVDLPEGIARWVADQLLEDFESRERLENLWNMAKSQTT